jgi:hypothetical protein
MGVCACCVELSAISLSERHLARKTFGQKDNCPERHLPRKTFAQKDICPDIIWPERHLARNTIAQITIARTIINQKYAYQEYNLLNENFHNYQL